MSLLVTNDYYSWEHTSADSSLVDSVDYVLPSKLVVEGFDLTRNGRQGQWFDSSGSLVAFDPSTENDGPSVLLFRRDSMAEYLAANKLCLFWTFLAERDIVGASTENYIGHVEANGFYLMNDGEITGAFVSKFFPKGTWEAT